MDFQHVTLNGRCILVASNAALIFFGPLEFSRHSLSTTSFDRRTGAGCFRQILRKKNNNFSKHMVFRLALTVGGASASLCKAGSSRACFNQQRDFEAETLTAKSRAKQQKILENNAMFVYYLRIHQLLVICFSTFANYWRQNSFGA